MITTTTVAVSFNLPAEHEAEKTFRMNHDMREWVCLESAGVRTYEKVERIIVDIKVEDKGEGYEDGRKVQEKIVYCGECKYMMPNGRCSQFVDSTIRIQTLVRKLSNQNLCPKALRKDIDMAGLPIYLRVRNGNEMLDRNERRE